MRCRPLALVLSVLLVLTACSRKKEPVLAPEEARAIAKEAYIYGFPMVDNYRIMYSYYVDAADKEYKGGWNEVHNIARVYTPEDKAVQTPNSDTPYTMIGADLRAEPLVLTMPAIESGRYYSAQFIDLYTFNFAYAGSRATGNGERRVDRGLLETAPARCGAVRRVRGIPSRVIIVVRSRRERIGQLVHENSTADDVARECALEVGDGAVREQLGIRRRVHRRGRQCGRVQLLQRGEISTGSRHENRGDGTKKACLWSHWFTRRS